MFWQLVNFWSNPSITDEGAAQQGPTAGDDRQLLER